MIDQDLIISEVNPLKGKEINKFDRPNTRHFGTKDLENDNSNYWKFENRWKKAESELRELDIVQGVDVEKLLSGIFRKHGFGFEVAIPEFKKDLVDAYKAAHPPLQNKKVWVERSVEKDGLPEKEGYYFGLADDDISLDTYWFSPIDKKFASGTFRHLKINHWLEQTQSRQFSVEDMRKCLINYQQWVIDNDVSQLLADQMVAMYLADEQYTNYLQSLSPYTIGQVVRCRCDLENLTAVII